MEKAEKAPAATDADSDQDQDKDKKIYSDRQHQSALDDSESEFNEADYTDSDNYTYEEGTLDEDGTLGTYEDSTPQREGEKQVVADETMAMTKLAKGDNDDPFKKPREPPRIYQPIPEEVRRNNDDAMDSMVKEGDWDGIIAHIDKVEKILDHIEKVEADLEQEETRSSGSDSASRSAHIDQVEKILDHIEKVEADLEQEETRSSGSHSGSRSGSHSISDSSSFESSSFTGSYSGSYSRSSSGSDSRSESRSEGSYNEDGTNTEDYTYESISESVNTSVAESPAEIQRKQQVRAEIDALVRLVVPDEADNIDAMLAQFSGREEELVAALRSMQARSVIVRT